MKSILDPSFRYVSSTDTDLRKTFARIRRARDAVKRITRSTAPTAEIATLPKRKEKAA